MLRVRAFNHLGPGQTPKFVAPALAERIARNERDGGTSIPVVNSAPARFHGCARRRAGIPPASSSNGDPGEAYNVCSGVAVTVQ